MIKFISCVHDFAHGMIREVHIQIIQNIYPTDGENSLRLNQDHYDEKFSFIMMLMKFIVEHIHLTISSYLLFQQSKKEKSPPFRFNCDFILHHIHPFIRKST
jgi:hypothetical protein